MASIQLAKDIIITAVEGGINHWAQTSGYHPSKGEVTIYDVSDGDFDEPLSVTHITAKMVKDKIKAFEEYSADNLYWGDEIDWEDMDSELADAVIQFVIMDEVVYG